MTEQRQQVIEYIKNTTPAEVAALVVEAMSFDDALTVGEWTISRARLKFDQEAKR